MIEAAITSQRSGAVLREIGNLEVIHGHLELLKDLRVAGKAVARISSPGCGKARELILAKLHERETVVAKALVVLLKDPRFTRCPMDQILSSMPSLSDATLRGRQSVRVRQMRRQIQRAGAMFQKSTREETETVRLLLKWIRRHRDHSNTVQPVLDMQVMGDPRLLGELGRAVKRVDDWRPAACFIAEQLLQAGKGDPEWTDRLQRLETALHEELRKDRKRLRKRLKRDGLDWLSATALRGNL
ncbi:MAG TPA: hypothetical protein VK968_03955 [Roseimicrobium sp.]|nr:hypothetical protein [Roseimicrobium sp.]